MITPLSSLQNQTGPPRTRIQSVDFLRGVVMVLMAIDHVRVYSGMPAGGPTAGIFFTRWITHFCVPTLCFLPGRPRFYTAPGLMTKSRFLRFFSPGECCW